MNKSRTGMIIVPIWFYPSPQRQMLTLCYEDRYYQGGKELITIVNSSLTNYANIMAWWGMAETAAFLFLSKSER